MKTFTIKTLGCKVNQYESDGIAACLVKAGWSQAGRQEPCDLCIVNTCTVTAKAGMQSRQAVRHLIRKHPHAVMVVTGCHVQTAPDQIREIDGVHHLVCHREKTRIPELAQDLLAAKSQKKDLFEFFAVDHTPSNCFHAFEDAVKGSMTRAYLKIQDGCNAFCTYCIVPHARGASVSMEPEQVLSHLTQLGESGFKEAILTGIHTGLYGRDLTPQTSLTDLIMKIDRLRPVDRIRLSSIEPRELDPALIDLAGETAILCDHFHIPLQSGDDDILKKMTRPYTRAFFANEIERIHEKLPYAGIGVDTLIGFPSETHEQFMNTYNLIEGLPVSYLHVFPFSPRKGTPAFHYPDKVKNDVIKERCLAMRELGRQKRKAFIQKNMGRTLKGLVQHRKDRKTGTLKAVTSNYLTIHLEPDKSGPPVKGQIIDVVLNRYDTDLNLYGTSKSY